MLQFDNRTDRLSFIDERPQFGSTAEARIEYVDVLDGAFRFRSGWEAEGSAILQRNFGSVAAAARAAGIDSRPYEGSDTHMPPCDQAVHSPHFLQTYAVEVDDSHSTEITAYASRYGWTEYHFSRRGVYPKIYRLAAPARVEPQACAVVVEHAPRSRWLSYVHILPIAVWERERAGIVAAGEATRSLFEYIGVLAPNELLQGGLLFAQYRAA